MYDIKAKAEIGLKSTTVDLATAKAERELSRDKPDLLEVNRLSQKAVDFSSELGL